MSVFLEFLKCILCCEDEYIDRSRQDDYIDISDSETSFRNIFSRTRTYNTFSSLVSTPSSSVDESSSITRTRNYPQHCPNPSLGSSLLSSARNESTWQSRPSDLPVKYKVVLDSETNSPAWIGSLSLKSVERTYQVPQNSRSSGAYHIDSSPTPTKPPQSSTRLTLTPPSPLQSSLKPLTSAPKPSPSLPKPPMPSKPRVWSTESSSSSSKPSPSSSTPSSSSSYPLPSLKPTLSPLPSHLTEQKGNGKYTRVDPKDILPIYMIPKDIENLIKRDIVPEVLKKPLSPSTYQDYFAALLYAEDYYIEKWSNFELINVSLELHPASIYEKSGGVKYSNTRNKVDNKTFVVFKVDYVSKKRPFLLSRDFVFAKPSGKQVEPFQGIIYRVVKSTTILVEFKKEFHSQHDSTSSYDIRFSFNRVCLKRAHQAIAAAAAAPLQKFLFPNSVSQYLMPTSMSFHLYNHKLNQDDKSVVRRILTCRGPPAFLIKGPLCATCNDDFKSFSKQLSRTGLVIKEAVLQIYQRHPGSKILVCAPINSTCDVLMRSLKLEIPESDMFRANAAFREVEGVPIDILPSCLYEKENDCFTCPSLQELRNFRVIFSTFVSSYRLYNAGIPAGHFSYIFLVDASSATEPETMVALANLANESTTVVVTGAPRNRSSCVRADMARQKGLRISYFERLSEFGPYKNGNPMCMAQLAK